jgi:hypothetical protein
MATGIAGEDIFTITQGIRVHRPTATTAADQDLFSIDGGNVLLLGFLGEVTTAIGAGSQDFEIDHDPDDGGSNVMLADPIALTPGDIVLDVTGTEAGSVEWWVWYVPIDVGASITAS